jgi:hypothetical protein
VGLDAVEQEWQQEQCVVLAMLQETVLPTIGLVAMREQEKAVAQLRLAVEAERRQQMESTKLAEERRLAAEKQMETLTLVLSEQQALAERKAGEIDQLQVDLRDSKAETAKHQRAVAEAVINARNDSRNVQRLEAIVSAQQNSEAALRAEIAQLEASLADLQVKARSANRIVVQSSDAGTSPGSAVSALSLSDLHRQIHSANLQVTEFKAALTVAENARERAEATAVAAAAASRRRQEQIDVATATEPVERSFSGSGPGQNQDGTSSQAHLYHRGNESSRDDELEKYVAKSRKMTLVALICATVALSSCFGEAWFGQSNKQQLGTCMGELVEGGS